MKFPYKMTLPDQMTKQQLTELKDKVDSLLCSMILEKTVQPDSSDIMTVLAHKYIKEVCKDDPSDWVSYRCGSIILFKRENIHGFYKCDSSTAPIDSYDKFAKLVYKVEFNELETEGVKSPFDVFTCSRRALGDSELVFGSGRASKTVVQTMDTRGMKPKRFVRSFDNEDEFLDCFETDRKDYFIKENPLCMYIFTVGDYELYMVDETDSAMYLIVQENRVVNCFGNATGGGTAVFHHYDDDSVLVLGKNSCTLLTIRA